MKQMSWDLWTVWMFPTVRNIFVLILGDYISNGMFYFYASRLMYMLIIVFIIVTQASVPSFFQHEIQAVGVTEWNI